MLRSIYSAFTRVPASCLAAAFAVLFGAAAVQAQNPITINHVGIANPYPSTINVSGRTGTVTKVTVTLTDFSHTYPDDVDIMLVAPNGASAIIMSDVGGSDVASGVNLTLDDAAATALPNAEQLTSGTYQPTNFGLSDPFVSPAPSTSANTALSTFNGINPNGDWQLFVIDDTDGDAGSIGNFSLTIQTAPPTAASGSIKGRVLTSGGRAISGARVTVFDVNAQQYHSAGSNQFGYFNLRELPVGGFYIITIKHKRYVFSDYVQGVQLNADETITFVAEP